MLSLFAAFMKFALVKKIALGISLAAPIGPVSVEVIRRGLKNGFRSAFIVCLGGAVGDTIYLVIAYFGLAYILSMPMVRMSILLFGACVLFYLGLQSILDGWRKNYLELSEKEVAVKQGTNAFLLGIVLALANPMSVMWWVGIFGGMMSASPDAASPSLLSNMTIILGVIVWSLFLSSFLAFGRRFVTPLAFKIISTLAGSCLVGFGSYFIYQALQILSGRLL